MVLEVDVESCLLQSVSSGEVKFLGFRVPADIDYVSGSEDEGVLALLLLWVVVLVAHTEGGDAE